MVTNLMEGMTVKCEQYWPEKGNTINVGPFGITTVEEQTFPYYVIRKLNIKVSIVYIHVADVDILFICTTFTSLKIELV